MEAKFDLDFVRSWTRELYAERGRPSIDPVVFFKLHLAMIFEGIAEIPAAGQVEIGGLNQFPLRANALEVQHESQPKEHHWVNARMPTVCLWVA